MSFDSMHFFHGMKAGAWNQGVIGARHGNTKYPMQEDGRFLEHSLLTIINNTIQCTNTNTDDAGNA